MSFYITADITCDINFGEIHLDKFKLLTLEYTMKGISYNPLSEDALSVKEFYEMMDEGALPTTSQLTPFTALNAWIPILEQGFDIIHISLSSAVSGSFQSAEIAAKELKEKYPDRKILIVDSLSVSAGEAFLIYNIDKIRSEGGSIEKAYESAMELRNKINHYFTVNSLFHLHRGGRLNKSQALIGTMLHLKPLLNINKDGQLLPIDKCVGRKTSLNWLANKLEERISPDYADLAFISHGNCMADAEFLKNKIIENHSDMKIVISDVNPVLGSHCGQGVVALFFISDKGRDDNNK